MKHRLYLYILFGAFLLSTSVADSKDAEKHPSHTHETMKVTDLTQKTVDLEEKIGEFIPPDIELIDENLTRYKVKDILDKPTVLALVYYYCPMACSLIQGNLANALNDVPSKLGQDFQVWSVSFDREETDEDARKAKTNYTKIIHAKPDETAWRFFTATPENIQRMTEAIGFKFIKTGPHQFIHPKFSHSNRC